MANWMFSSFVAGGFVFVLGIGAAHAQSPDAPAGSEASDSRDPAPAEQGTAVEVEEPAEAVPDKQKGARSTQALSRMKAILNSVLGHLSEAREEKDVVKLNCVNEKLTAIKGLLKISEQADISLREALARKDSETGVHEFDKIDIALRKCEQLLAESEACVGELAVYAGDTDVDIEEEDIPPDEPEEQLEQTETFIDTSVTGITIPVASQYL